MTDQAAVSSTELFGAAGTTQSPAPAPSWQPIGVPVTPAAFDAPEAVAARAAIQERQAEFYDRMVVKKDPAALAEWTALHKAGNPRPSEINTAEDVKAYVATDEGRRGYQAHQEHVSWLTREAQLTPQQQYDVNNRTPVSQAEKDWASAEIEAMKHDKEFYRRLNAGDRAAKSHWLRMNQILRHPTAVAR
jgi:hypothetical protein